MKNRTNRLTIMLAMLVTVLAFSMTVSAGTAADLDKDYTGKVVILQSNDVHGEIEGYQYMAGLKNELVKRGADVIMVDCGDFTQGSTYVSNSKGESAIDLMNQTGYDIIVPGNHEFDFGPDVLKYNMENAEFTVLCSDFVSKEDGKPVFKRSKVITTDGVDKKKDTKDDVRIGFIGITTPETLAKAIPTNFKDATFLTKDTDPSVFEDFTTRVNKVEKKADIVIALSHLGVDASSEPYRSYDLWSYTQAHSIGNGLDMILDGQSHTAMTAGTKGESIMSTGSHFHNIGVVVIDEKTKSIEKNFLYPLKELAEGNEYDFKDDLKFDVDVQCAAQDYIDEINEEYSQEFAETKVDLNGNKTASGDFANGNRDGETNMGDLIADAVRAYVKNSGYDLGVDDDHVVVVINGGGIRASVPAGEMTMKDVQEVLPFGDSISAVKIKGSRLLEVLEASTYRLPEASGSFPQIAGMNITINTAKEYKKGKLYKDSTYYAPESINRVIINDINGSKFDKKAKYVVLTADFCATGGDTYHAFLKSKAKCDTGIQLDYAVCEYIKNDLKGVVDDKYKEPAGRIKIIKEQE